MGKIIAVCSGSGGVGKTTIAAALSASLAKAGKKVIFLDASGISRSSDLIFGMESVVSLDLMDVISEQIPIEAALYPVRRYEGLRFACASLYDGISVSELSGVILALHSMCDMLVIDMPTGQCALGKGILCRDDERIIVLRPDDASIRSAERLIVAFRDDEAQISLVVNRMDQDRIKAGLQYKTDTVSILLDQMVFAEIPEEPGITKFAAKGQTAMECTSVRTQIQKLAQTLLGSAN